MKARCCCPPESSDELRVGAARPRPDVGDRLLDDRPVAGAQRAEQPALGEPAGGDDLADRDRALRRRSGPAGRRSRASRGARSGARARRRGARRRRSAAPARARAGPASSCRRRSGPATATNSPSSTARSTSVEHRLARPVGERDALELDDAVAASEPLPQRLEVGPHHGEVVLPARELVLGRALRAGRATAVVDARLARDRLADLRREQRLDEHGGHAALLARGRRRPRGRAALGSASGERPRDRDRPRGRSARRGSRRRRAR